MHGSTPPWRPAATVAGSAQAPPGARTRSLLAVVLLGVNLWGMAVLWPLLGSARAPALERWLAPACLVPLWLGAAAYLLLARRPRLANTVASGSWLAAYPAALASWLAARAERDNLSQLGAAASSMVVLALCAFGACAAAACAERRAPVTAVHAPLGAEPWDAPGAERRLLQRFIVGLTAAGALAIAVVAPAPSGWDELERGWGEAALEGGVLTAVVGAALGVATLAVFLGGALRTDNTAPPRGEPKLRAAWFLLLALLGGVTYFVVQP
jgi:hypothetical protein